MPSYVSAPGQNAPVKQLLPGVPGYAFGSFDASSPTTLLQITAVAKASSVATYTVLIREGKIPAIGSLLTTRGLATAGFNQNNVAITGVSIDSTTGIGTITAAITAGTVTTTADAGQGYVPVPEVGEAITGSVQTSQAFAIPQPENKGDQGTVLRWTTSYPSAPGTIAIQLEVAEVDVDAQYASILTSTSTTGEEQSTAPVRYRFVRAKITASTGGTLPTAVVKILV